mmetsp:Transcript_51989/g.143949  ORF Transcript_51989/g.143949 Transcript_51989/m.143949 type:complete len:241 (+) Transcript_51989:192-914(+)
MSLNSGAAHALGRTRRNRALAAAGSRPCLHRPNHLVQFLAWKRCSSATSRRPQCHPSFSGRILSSSSDRGGTHRRCHPRRPHPYPSTRRDRRGTRPRCQGICRHRGQKRPQSRPWERCRTRWAPRRRRCRGRSCRRCRPRPCQPIPWRHLGTRLPRRECRRRHGHLSTCSYRAGASPCHWAHRHRRCPDLRCPQCHPCRGRPTPWGRLGTRPPHSLCHPRHGPGSRPAPSRPPCFPLSHR